MSWNLEDYEPVEDRLAKFWADHPDGRITTSLLEHTESRYIVQAYAWRTSTQEYGPDASGLAEETVGSSPVNKTSALENCETSAIGRALANLGYAAKGRASREEMDKASRPEPILRSTRPATNSNDTCPECGEGVWDNRAENARREANGENKRPDFKCRKCQWVQWDAETVEVAEGDGLDDVPAPELREDFGPDEAPF